jgi:ribosomal protein S18 acetylase RimI-like enzyme
LTASETLPTSKIRSIEPDDIPPIAYWMSQVPLWQRYKLTVESITQQFQNAILEKALINVIEIGEQEGALGFAWYSRQGAFARSPYLKQIGIHPNFTGMGIGGQLLASVEEDCKHFSDQLFLLVSDFNTDAQKFYKRNGYEHIGAIPNYVLPDVAELIYHKRLLD